MAAVTGREGGIAGDLTSREVMTLLAGDLCVASPQRVARAIVIKRSAIDGRERRGLMAPAAGGAELAAMDVRMTSRAFAIFEGLESRNRSSARRARQLQPRRFVTCGAFHRCVGAGERVVRLCVVETGNRLPVLDVVTREAILVESALMRVDVA
jgi:hypothetical protein